MGKTTLVYICPKCFEVSFEKGDANKHAHKMILCDFGELGDERRKPVKDKFNHYVSSAPRWFLEAIGWYKKESTP